MSESNNSRNRGFQDPLGTYDSPEFSDPVEEAIHGELVSGIQTQPHLSVSADTSVREAMPLMVGHHIACVLVEQDDVLVGVFGDRDVLDKVALEYDEVIDGPVSAAMSHDPVSVREADSVAKVLSIMAISGYRHVPVVSSEGKAVGIVSPQRIGRFLHQHLQPVS